jgi:hypothetical protein
LMMNQNDLDFFERIDSYTFTSSVSSSSSQTSIKFSNRF